jgi:hypothetical protein
MRKSQRAAALLLVAGLLLVALPPSSAFAHTGVDNTYIETVSSLDNGVTFLNPQFSYNTGTGQLQFHVRWTGCTAASANTAVAGRVYGKNGDGTFTYIAQSAQSWAGSFFTCSATQPQEGTITVTQATLNSYSNGYEVRIYRSSDSSTLTRASDTAYLYGPVAPGSLTATGVAGGIKLDWTQSGGNPGYYQVERSADGGTTFTSIESRLGGAARTYLDSPVNGGAERTYRLRGCSSGGTCSAWVIVTGTAGAAGGTSSSSTTDMTAYCTAHPAANACATPTSTDTSEGDTASATCSWYDLFCHIVKALKWAFVPGTTTTAAWSSFKTTLETKPPFSLVIGGISWLTGVVQGALQAAPGSNTGPTGGDQFGCISGAAWGPVDVMNGNNWCISNVAEDIRMQNESFFAGIRNLIRIGLYVMVAFSMWSRLGHFIGMIDVPKPASGGGK